MPVQITGKVALDMEIQPGLVQADGLLTVRVQAFNYEISGGLATYGGAVSVAVTNETTNYLYIDNGGVLQVNQSGWPAEGHARLASVIASGGAITSIMDERVFITYAGTGGSGGESNTASNVGAGAGLYKEKIGVDLRFRSLTEGTAIAITSNTDDVQIGLGTHAASHQDGGGDEINIGGLSGVCADDQPPQAHDIAGAKHTGTLAHASLSGVSANDHHAQLHNTAHQNGGGDEINIGGLSGVCADDQPPQAHDIAGAKHTGTLAHSSLSGVSANDHHAQLHNTSHQSGGGDEISVAGLSGVLTSAQNADKLQGRNVASTVPADGQVLTWDNTESQWEPSSGSGTGDVVGPSSSTDDGIARFDGTSGKLLQNSTVKVDDSGRVSAIQNATFSGEHDNGTSGSAKTIDWGNGQKQKITMSANCTFTFTAPSGVGNFILKIIQDASGGHTITWPAAVLWPSGTPPTMSLGATATDLVALYYDGTNYLGLAAYDFR